MRYVRLHLLSALIVLCFCATAPAVVILDFEDLVLGDRYTPKFGAHPWQFQTGPATVEAREFFWLPTGSTKLGIIEVQNGGLAGGSGLELMLNNVNADFDFGKSYATDLWLEFGEYGGNINIDINGDFHNFNNFTDIDGMLIGGAKVSVVNGFGNDKGRLHLAGTVPGAIHSFQIGGQELWIDNLRFEEWCPPKPGNPDLNGDGAVDGADAGILFSAWTGDGVPTHGVPEPAGLLPLATCLLGLLGSARRFLV